MIRTGAMESYKQTSIRQQSGMVHRGQEDTGHSLSHFSGAVFSTKILKTVRGSVSTMPHADLHGEQTIEGSEGETN